MQNCDTNVITFSSAGTLSCKISVKKVGKVSPQPFFNLLGNGICHVRRKVSAIFSK